MIDLSIQGRHGDPLGAPPAVIPYRHRGPSFDATRPWAVQTCAQLRSELAAKSDTVLLADGRVFVWSSTAYSGASPDTNNEGARIVVPTGDTTGGAYVLASSSGLPGTTTTLSETPIATGSGTVTLWSYAVPESTNVTAVVDANFSTASGERWIGSLYCVAHRHGAGALTVDAQAMGASLLLSDPDWNPEFHANGNALELRVTADSAYSIVPRGRVRCEAVSTVGDPQISALAAARQAVLADAPLIVYYADVGLTPASPSVGADVTGWADQSGNAKNLTFISNREPHYGLDGAWPYLELADALDVASSEIDISATGARVYRFTLDSTATGVFGILFHRTNDTIAVHTGNTFNTNGNKIMVGVSSSTYLPVGTMLDGKHCYEIRLDPTAQTATLYVDGVAGTPTAMGPFSTPYTYGFRLGFVSAGLGPTGNLYGFELQDGAGTDAQMNRWITMSELAWGAND